MEESFRIDPFMGSNTHIQFINEMKAKELEVKGPFGRNLLHQACLMQNQKVVQLLLEKGLNNPKKINVKDQQGNSPMHQACQSGNKQIVLMLLLEKAKCLKNKNNDGLTPIDVNPDLRPFILHVKCQETGFRMLGQNYPNKRFPTISGKIRENLDELFKWLDMDNTGFVSLDNLRDADSRLFEALRQYSAIPKRDQLLTLSSTLPSLNNLNPDDTQADEQRFIDQQISKQDEQRKREDDFLRTQQCDKLDYLIDFFCQVDKPSKKFTKEEFFFAMIRQQLNALDFEQFWMGTFLSEFKMYWNKTTLEEANNVIDEGALEGNDDEDGGDDGGDDDE